METSQNEKKSLVPVAVGLVLALLVALVIGISLPNAVRGYDVEDLATPPFETRLERDQSDLQAKEMGLDRRADYVTWKSFGYSECAILDMGDLRIAVPRIRTRGSKTWMGRIKVKTDALPKEVNEKKPYRVGGKRLWFESRWIEGANECSFCDLPFQIRDGRLHIADEVFVFGEGKRILVVNRRGKLEAGLRIESDGSLKPLQSN